MFRIGALALAAITGSAALADTPLPPPERTVLQIGTSVVTADPALGSTMVRTPGLPDWTIPGWHRVWSLSPDAEYFLAVQHGGNLIAQNTADTVAFTLHSRHGCAPVPITLGQLPGTGATLPRTTSNFVLFNNLSWDAAALAWRVTLGSDEQVLIYPTDCAAPGQGG